MIVDSDKEYRLQHQAPTDDGYSARLHEARSQFGPDVLERPDLYGTADDETLRQMRAAVEDPAAELRIYRAVPPEHPEINDGDWVTLSRAYAHDHGYVDDGPDWPVVYADVPAERVWTDGNDPSEYGYDGPDLVDLDRYTEDEPMPPHPLDTTEVVDERRHVETTTIRFRASPGAAEQRRVPPASQSTGRGRDIPDR